MQNIHLQGNSPIFFERKQKISLINFYIFFLITIKCIIISNIIYTQNIFADEITHNINEHPAKIESNLKYLTSIIELNQAEIVILNKITAKSVRKIFDLDKIYNFGNLTIEVDRCVKNTNLFNANNLALLSVHDQKPSQAKSLIFYGWLISSNLSISNIEHPVYEIMIMDCKKSIN